MNRFALTAAISLAAVSLGHERIAAAQTREPLCVQVESRRVLAGDRLWTADDDRMAVAPFASVGPHGERFVLVMHETLDGVSAPHSVRRDVGELGYQSLGGLAGQMPPGRVVLRLDDQLRTVGQPVFVRDPVETPPVNHRPVATLPVAVTLGSSVLLLERMAGDLYATRISSSGDIAAPQRIAAAPTPVEGNARGFEWLTAIARTDGAIALAGTFDGQVIVIRFDRDGVAQGNPSTWTQRVGGPMQLIPSLDGPIAALLGRPVPGTGPNNEQARMQVLVSLDDHLRPSGEPFATGFAQFPIAMVQRGRTMNVFQWAEQQGIAIATLPIGDRRFGEQLPRLFYAQSPLEGGNTGHAATAGASGIVLDVANYSESQGGMHGHLAWLPPSGAPVLRRDVLALRGRPAFGPAVIPAADGVVVFVASEDETGGAVDAYHVRCDLVNVPGE